MTAKLMAISLLLICAAGFAQTGSLTAIPAGLTLDKPYCATQVADVTQTTPAGMQTKLHSETYICRNSAGAERIEHKVAEREGSGFSAEGIGGIGILGGSDAWEPAMTSAPAIVISKPADGGIDRIQLYPEKKLAVVSHISLHTATGRSNSGSTTDVQSLRRAAAGGCAPVRPPVTAVKPVYSEEHLGTQELEGQEARGTRRTTHYPAGLDGHGQPQDSVTEVWLSPYLGRPILIVSDGPIWLPRRCDGPVAVERQSRTAATEISTAEPPATLFEIPDGYTVKRKPARNAVSLGESIQP